MEISITEMLMKILEQLNTLERKVDKLSVQPNLINNNTNDLLKVGADPTDIKKRIEDMKRKFNTTNTPAGIGQNAIGMAGANGVMAGMGLMGAATVGVKEQDDLLKKMIKKQKSLPSAENDE